jgi:hypothetical protein
MISERDYQLLTAYVDGELSARQRKCVLRLLRRNPTARALLQELRRDSILIHELPRHKLPADFSQRLMRIASSRPPARPALRMQPRLRPMPLWLGLAAAAMLLLSVGALAFVVFRVGSHFRPRPEMVVQNSASDYASHSSEKMSSSGNGPLETDASSASAGSEPGSASVAIDSKKPEELPQPQPPLSEDKMVALFGNPNIDPAMEISQPKEADVLHSDAKQVRELKAADVHASLDKGKNTALRLDVACKSSNTALHRVKNVLASANINLVIEQVAEHRLKHAKMKTNYVVFVEDLTADELSRLLERLAQEDLKAEVARKGDGVFQGLVISRMNDAGVKEFKEILGPSYGKALHIKLPAGSGSGSADSKKSASGSMSRPESSKGSGRGHDRCALALPYNPVRPPKDGSAEIHKFLQSRKQPRPDTLQVLLVLSGT